MGNRENPLFGFSAACMQVKKCNSQRTSLVVENTDTDSANSTKQQKGGILQNPVLSIGRWAGAVLVALVVTGCADTRSIGRSTGEFRIEPGIANATIPPKEFGIFYDNDRGVVRARLNNKPLIGVIDDLAYKVGFNYTVLSDMSAYRVSLEEANGEQVVREGAQPMLESLLDRVNRSLPAGEPRLHFRWISDGPELFLSKAAIGDAMAASTVLCSRSASVAAADCASMSFKKMFFKNVTADEALTALSQLFEAEVEIKRDAGQGKSLDSKKAAIVAYRAQNALLVRSKDLAVYERLAELLPSLDADFQLVLVETQVFEYDDSVARKIGVALDYKQGEQASDPTKAKFQLATQFGEGITSILPRMFWNFSNIDRKATLLSTLAFYDRDGLVRIMAEPRLTLKSGESAEVELASKRFYITPGVNTPGDIRELATGIFFKVQPTVLGDGKILLKLTLRQSEFVPSNDPSSVSSTNDNRIDTAVIARDGELVSLGGILSKHDTKFASGLPGLRKLPGVGFLFGSEATDGNVTRVEFMIRPTVNRASQRNDGIVKNLRDMNCRITKYMNKTNYECQDPVEGNKEVDLDGEPAGGKK